MSRKAAALLAAALAAAPATASAVNEEAARESKARAERAIVEKRFCDAAFELGKVYEHSSNSDAIFNAALAAEKSGDRVLAASTYDRFVELAPLSKLKAKAVAKADKLRKEIDRKGPGTRCPEQEPEAAVVVAPAAAPQPEPVRLPEPEPAPATATSPITIVPAPPPPEPPVIPRIVAAEPGEDRSASRPGKAPEQRSDGTLRTVGWVLLGVGGAGLATGGVFTVTAAQQAGELEARAGPDAVFDQEARELETGYQRDGVIGASGLIGGGLLAATGLVMILLDPPESP